MVTDHTAAAQQLAQGAATLGIALSSTMNKSDQAVLTRLSKLTGSTFDLALTRYFISDHKKEIASFTQENKKTGNSILKTFAMANIPMLQSHLNLWQATLITLSSGSTGT